MWYHILLKPVVLTGALLSALAGCSGPPVSIESPPLDADGQSRWLFVQVVSQDLFVGELYARKAGAGSWGDDLVFVNNIYPGQGKAYNLSDGSGACRFDLRLRIFPVNDAPQYQDQLNVDLCAMNKKKQAWLL